MSSRLRRRIGVWWLAAVVGACSGSGDPASSTTSPTTSTDQGERLEVTSRVVETDPSFEIGQRSGPYEVVYLVEDLDGEATPQRTEVVVVRPPFESRRDERGGPPPGGEILTRQVVVMDRLRFGGLEDPLTVHRVPGPTPSDVRVPAVLDAAVREGLVELGEQRLVSGRRCQVVVTGTVLGAETLRPLGGDERAETCLDADGIVIEETLYLDGDPVFRRAAVEVVSGDAVTDERFDAGAVSAPVEQGGGSVLPVDPDVGSLGSFWDLPDGALPGFDHVGRYAVVPPQPEKFDDPTLADAVVAGTADVHRRGVDVVVVYQGGSRGGVEAFAPVPGAIDVDGDALGAGELLLGAARSQLRFPREGGRFVHVIGTLPPDDLAEVARSLAETEGTGLVYLDED